MERVISELLDPERTNPADTLISNFQLQNWERIGSCCLSHQFVAICCHTPGKL